MVSFRVDIASAFLIASPLSEPFSLVDLKSGYIPHRTC